MELNNTYFDRLSELKNKSLLNSISDKKINNIKEDEKLRETCNEFEAVFTKMILKEMQNTIHKENDIIGNSQAQDIFTDLLHDEYSKESSKKRTLGISDILYNQLSNKYS